MSEIREMIRPIREVIKVVENSSIRFIVNEQKLLLSGVAEITLCGSLMKYFKSEVDNYYFREYHVDVEYNLILYNWGFVRRILQLRRYFW